MTSRAEVRSEAGPRPEAEPRSGAEPRSEEQELARLIRGSKALEPAVRRQWLRVLPHLLPVDRARLRAILAEAQPPDPPGR